MSQQPSIKDVAAKAQVSIATVSRVLNHKGGFSKITFDKVHKAMADLGYQPNRLAQALKSDSIKMIALSVPLVGHPFNADFAIMLKRNYKIVDMVCYFQITKAILRAKKSFYKWHKKTKLMA